jgi:pimeloyl-ACP methyl ester carboxylesterase
VLATSAAPAPTFDFGAEPTLEQLRAIKFLPVPDGVTAHRFEERGFVTVPMDYARREASPTLRIFYRLMPKRGSTATDTKAPILVVLNGGPGVPSSAYRPYDFDYERPTEKMRARDLLGELLTTFRVLIVDQRGTPGYSAPLDMSDPGVNSVVVARYFDAAHHGLDHQEVIRAVVPDGEPFYLLAQSYGGMIGMRYLTMPEITRQPRGIIFASAKVAHTDTLSSFESRRISQRKLNMQLLATVPGIKGSLARLRAHFRRNGFDPGSVHYLWSWLGKGPPGVWERSLGEKVAALLRADRRGLRAFLDEEALKADLLNYILSAKELTTGFTDRSLAALLAKRMPFEHWMLDEQWTLLRMEGDASWTQPVLAALDRNPPPFAPPFPSLAEIGSMLADRDVLFTFGEGDAFSGESSIAFVREFLARGRVRVQVLPGGHRAAFLRPGVDAIAAWIASLPPGT